MARFSLNIVQIQYCKLLLAYLGVPDHTHMNRLNQINVSLHFLKKTLWPLFIDGVQLS